MYIFSGLKAVVLPPIIPQPIPYSADVLLLTIRHVPVWVPPGERGLKFLTMFCSLCNWDIRDWLLFWRLSTFLRRSTFSCEYASTLKQMTIDKFQSPIVLFFSHTRISKEKKLLLIKRNVDLWYVAYSTFWSKNILKRRLSLKDKDLK